jgi:hypothetical protein
MFVIHVCQYVKKMYDPPRGGYIYSRTKLTQEISRAKRFKTEDEALDYEVDIEDEMSAGVIEVD